MDSRLVLRAVDISADVPCPQAGPGPACGLVPMPAESLRAAAMQPDASARFLAGRAALRRFAAQLLGIPAAQLRAAYSCPQCGSGPDLSHGRPGFTHHCQPLPLLLSMARAGNWVLLAGLTAPVAGEQLGVDVEDPERLGFDGFDAVALAEAEKRAVAGLEGTALRRQRARLWTRKEAWLKMTGDGLRTDPREVAVLDKPGLTDLTPAATGLPASLVAAVALGQLG
ncbi:4'-phosphopantetheinyl transferase family protein [Arthrobacter sp. ZGTC412]|uniref:4'-phosphopantetheinyl transferase family protein n=1 Tax=Arthrobacter sp. ZGTC412 TaxID=2058900 RepID=UPI000CE3E9F6|nr:4'-phosphopantetheinyl transferase superfamily protein [Arthrobacter sp. ZGTC412]